MSASPEDHPAVDTICPHGPVEYRGPDLQFVDDSDIHQNSKGAIYEPAAIERGEDAWIQADRDAFVEVGSR